MSHITEIKTKITDLTALRLAVEELGGELKQGQRTHKWYGEWVGDTSMPKGMTKADLGKCDHAIAFPGCRYEVGVRQQEDKSYTLVYDYFNSGGLDKVLGENAGPLVQGYAKHKTVREAQRLGHRVLGVRHAANGSVKVLLQEGAR